MASLVALERLLAPAAAYLLWVEQGLRAMSMAGLLAMLLAARRVAERTYAVRAEGELYRQVTEAVLGAPVLKPTLVKDQETRLTLFNSLNRIARVLSETLPHLAADLIASFVLLAIIVARERAGVMAVSVAAVLCAGAVLYISRGAVARAHERSWATWDDMANDVEDACEGRLELVASGRARDFLARFDAKAREWAREALHAARLSSALGRLPVVVLAAAVGSAVILGARISGASWSTALLPAIVLATFAPAFLGVARCLQELGDVRPRVEMVEAVVRRRNEEVPDRAKPVLPPTRIEWKDVRYAYGPGAPDVLRSVSFVWRRHQVVMLAGANGSGKSTCLRLVLGLTRPSAGEILIDGRASHEFDLTAWRRGISFLPQRSYLPERASVRQALQLFDRGLSDQQMLHALTRVEVIDRLARSHPGSLDVRIGELSAGERQRVALARVLCRDAPVILLDEPDANLDADGIRLVARIVRELAHERMLLVVAHTKELLATSDRILTLRSGVLVSDVEREDQPSLTDRPA